MERFSNTCVTALTASKKSNGFFPRMPNSRATAISTATVSRNRTDNNSISFPNGYDRRTAGRLSLPSGTAMLIRSPAISIVK